MFLENKSPGLHLAADNTIFVKIFLVGAGIFVHFGEGAYPPFKGIQGH